ncbi:MAG: TM1802 family CRISPR-associated protein [Nanoarchaeota archaeon]
MINCFTEWGKNNINLNDKFSILKAISFSPDVVKNKFNKITQTVDKMDLYPLIINFDTQNDKIDMNYGKQEEVGEFLCLEKESSNGPKISFYTNNIHYHLSNTLYDFLTLLKNKFPEKTGMITYLANVMQHFYLFENNKPSINYKKIDNADLIEEINSLDYINNAKNKISELITKKKFQNHCGAFVLKIDGEHILKSQYKEDYIDVIYHFYIQKIINYTKKGRCHICNNTKDIIQEVKFPLTFYNLDKAEFFYNGLNKGKNNNSTKSFSICKECFVYTKTGQNLLYDLNSKNRYLNFEFMVIPANFYSDEDFGYVLMKLNEQLNRKFGKKSIKNLENSKKDNLIFSLMFIYKKQSQFKIIKDIPDLSLFELIKIDKLIGNINKIFANDNYQYNLGEIKKILFSNKLFKDEKIAKDLINLIDSIYNKIPIDKKYIIETVLANYKKNYYDKKLYENHQNMLKSFLFIDFLILNKNMEMNKMEIETYTKLENKDLIDFFNKNPDLIAIERGLITFGYLINKIIREQRNKSSTFIKKVGFDGINEHKLMELFNEFKEYCTIYKIDKYDNAERTYVAEIIGKIFKKGNLQNIEVNYYILLGIELGRYIGQKYSKKLDKGEKNE